MSVHDAMITSLQLQLSAARAEADHNRREALRYGIERDDARADVTFLLKMLARARCGCFALDCTRHGAYVAEDIERCEQWLRTPAGHQPEAGGK